MRLPVSAALFAVCCALPIYGESAAATPAGSTVSIGNPIALTFYVAPAHLAEAEAKAKSIQTVGSPDYHHFLTRPEFVADYAVSDTELQAIEGSLKSLGFNISYVFPNHLAIEVTGTVSTAESALGIKLNKLAAANGKTSFAPDRTITLPASLEGKIRGVGGLNTLIHARPLHVKSVVAGQSTTHPVGKNNLVGGTPGDYLPADFARFYGVDGVYNRGYKGRGTTIGIVTLNDFKTSDAYLFWKSIGLTVNQNRITKVDVDGGIEAPSNNVDGAGETDLDTEYSGALAPDANLRVYIAPNDTNAGFTNGFEAAASENIADTVSTSWGEPELYYFANPDSPFGAGYPSETYALDEFHDVFLEMAIQGQTLYAAAGDSGSFDTVRSCPAFGQPSVMTPVCNAPYAVDTPSNDPLVTAAGGTTLPFSFLSNLGVVFSVPQERAWGWDYLAIEAAGGGFDLLPDVFSVGGGGGVSSYFGVPWYQTGHQGITRTMPGQALTVDTGSGPLVDVKLPAYFAGRNTPDLSSNADPESGYQYIQDGSVSDFYGGTSFVAPQLNGVTALFVEAMGGRIGQINPFLYRYNYSASKDNKLGDNWGYQAITGYDNATGVGTLTADKLLDQMFYIKNFKK